MATGFANRTTTIQLPRGGFMAAPIFSGYGGHDPYLNGANPYAGGASQAGALGVGGGGGMPGYGGFGGGGYGGGMSLGPTYDAGANAAKNANEDRFQTGLKGYRDRYERNLATVKGIGSTVAGDIHRRYDQRAAQLRRQFAGGQSGNQSTVLAREIAANDRERNDAISRAADVNAGRQIAVDTQLSGDELGFLERKTDSYPDVNQMIDLERGAGAASQQPQYPPGGNDGGYGYGYGDNAQATTTSPTAAPPAINKKKVIGDRIRDRKALDAARRANAAAVDAHSKASIVRSEDPPHLRNLQPPQDVSHTYDPVRGFVPQYGGGSPVAAAPAPRYRAPSPLLPSSGANTSSLVLSDFYPKYLMRKAKTQLGSLISQPAYGG